MEPSKAPEDLKVDSDFPVMAVVYIAVHLLNQNPRRTQRHALAKIRKLVKFMSVSRITTSREGLKRSKGLRLTNTSAKYGQMNQNALMLIHSST